MVMISTGFIFNFPCGFRCSGKVTPDSSPCKYARTYTLWMLASHFTFWADFRIRLL